MTRRPRPAAIFIALVVASSTLFGSSVADQALGADPLSEAQANQRQLEETLAQQRQDLASLKSLSASLEQRLAAAEAELSAVSAEYERVAGLLVQVELQIADVQARLEKLRGRIAALDQLLVALAVEIERQKHDLAVRESLLQDHMRDAYERSQTSLLEVMLAADSFEVVG